MFRELAIFIYAVSIVRGSSFQPINAPVVRDASSQLPATAASYQNILRPSTVHLHAPASVSYEMDPAVVKTISGPVPMTSKNVNMQANVNQQTAIYTATVASDPRSPEHNAHTPDVVTYGTHAISVRPYYTVPVAAKSISIDSHGAVNTYPPSGYAPQYVGPVVTYASNAVPLRPFYAGPVTANTVTVNAQSPVAYATHQVDPDVSYASNAALSRPYYSVPVAAKTVTLDSHSPGMATYPLNQGQTMVNPQMAQYVPISRLLYAVNPAVTSAYAVPVKSKSGTVQSYNSVIAHPSPAPKYVTQPALLRYAPAPIPVTKPIPVPVMYQAKAVETHHPSVQQFAVVTNTVAPSYAQASIRAQPIPVPVEYPIGVNSGASVRYHSIPNPVVHAKSFVEKVSPTPTPVAPAGPEYGYARVMAYSPASAVSRVTFNGLGVSYGW